MMTTRRSPRRLLAASACLAIAVCLGLALLPRSPSAIVARPGERLLASLLGHDTVLSPGFSDREFQGIRDGMTPNEVVSAVGEPLQRAGVSAGAAGFLVRGVPQDYVDEIWWYSRSLAGDNRTRAGNNFWRRAVFFYKGRVSGKYSDFYRD